MATENGILEVYHAGTDIVKAPDCKRGRKNLDFGQGFYITDIYDQAINFARLKSVYRNLPPVINVYLLNKIEMLKEAKSLIFDEYDGKWLDFVVACRSGKDVWKKYDYVEGGVADDRVINAVSLYTQGFLSRDEVLRRIKYFKPNNQICLINQELLDRYLKFTKRITPSDNGLL